MRTFVYPNHPLSVSLAEALLGAWILGDVRKVSAELERSEVVDPDLEEGEEAERIQLLKAIAQRMQTCPNLFAPPSTDPALDLCVDLLAHLAGNTEFPN
ncbi:MAG TPA: hypothetical protein VKF41_03055 [Bryobacteraceae bacterium]|nr:hypothetical protein [Bryobacteraceae bacterium]